MNRTSAAMISFRGSVAPAWVLAGLESGQLAAVCLFNYNVQSLTQLRELTDSLRAAAARGGHPPPLIGIDQEGGQLMAVGHGTTELPGNMALGATRDAALARRTGELLADELLALGCNMNFAPVLDLASQLASHVVGVRAFSDDSALAARLGAALIKGMQSRGVLATAKHFPGHGRTAFDSHLTSPTIELTPGQLAEDLEPFHAAVAAGVAAVMSAHVTYPQLDSQPATHSRRILTGLLREQLGYGGLVVTDAMDMRAVTEVPPPESCLRALRAGADLVLLGHLHGQEELTRLLAEHTDAGSRQRVQDARARLATELPDLDVLASHAHLELAAKIADSAVTVVRGQPQLRLQDEDPLLLVSFESRAATPADSTGGSELQLLRQMRLRHRLVREVRVGADTTVRDLPPAAAVVVATSDAAHDPRQRALVEQLVDSGADPTVIALRNPLDAAVLHRARHVLCTYGWRPVQTEAACKVLFGELEARGQLPVQLPGRQESAL